MAAKLTKSHACPFCKLQFTSSSLGRHLDLYIRSANPKQSDDVHDLDKIRTMRGRITRRQPRTSRAKQEIESTSELCDSSVDSPANHDDHSETADVDMQSRDDAAIASPVDGAGSGMISPVNHRANDKISVAFNTANWQATGVINHVSSGAGLSNDGREVPVMPTATTTVPQPDHLSDDVDIGRAAQLALREVLQSLESARAQVPPQPLFVFDYFSMSFPAVCLHTLPGSLTSAHTGTYTPKGTWSFDPPSAPHLEAVQKHITSRAKQAGLAADSPDLQRIYSHLDDAYSHWTSLSIMDQEQSWKIEGLRAYAATSQSTKNKDAELTLLKQQLHHMRSQYDAVCSDQLPRELLLRPLDALPLSQELSRAVTQIDQVWDYEKLMAKWRQRVANGQTTNERADP